MPQATPARLLIVDDEAPLMTALCNTLREQGYDTSGFISGRNALDALRREKFDLLLTDLMMPEMDGIALLRAALQADPDLVAVMITGEGAIATAVEAMKAGASDYILKPFKLSLILPVLSRALNVRALRLENAQLNRRIRERATELEETNKELESFSYSVSHDLRAPLRHINAFSHLLLEQFSTQLPEEAQRLLSIVVTSGRRMEQLIEDLLRFSRLGRQSLSKQPVNVLLLVRDVLAELPKEPGRQVEVRIGDLLECAADGSLLRQVFVNLLSNSFKFSRQKEQAIIEVGCQQKDGEQVYFVRDNGAGFEMQQADRLFGVFQRLHSAAEYEGTGVGLSIVQRIVQRHGGRVWAESELDKGATFYFTLSAAPPAKL